MLDDFGMLAIARFLDNPFEPFYREHIPGGMYYRPAGMLLWWASERLFGPSAASHYAINLALHIGVAIALYGVVSRLGENRWMALVAAICLASHPIGLGTTVWLSDRFDLLALLLGLLGLRCALEYSATARARALAGTLVFLVLALLAKEMALALFAAAAVHWLCCAQELNWRRRLGAILCLLLLVAAYWIVRTSVLPNAGAESLFALKSPVRLFVDGIANWTSGWLDYLAYWSRMSGWKLAAAIAGFVLFAISGAVALVLPWDARRVALVVTGLTILASSALLQWPLLGFQPLPFEQGTATLDVVVNSRFYYTALAGFLIFVCGWLKPLQGRWPLVRWSLLLAPVLLVPAWLVSAQHLIRHYRDETRIQQHLVESAVERIGTLGHQTQGCQIYLLDTSDWRFGWVSDEAIKAVFPDLGEIERCLIQTEHAPWYHIVSVDALDAQAWMPLTLARGFESQGLDPPIGRGHFLTLNLSADSVLSLRKNVYYFSWRDGRFVDVGGEVRERRLVPALRCNRRAVQCP